MEPTNEQHLIFRGHYSSEYNSAGDYKKRLILTNP